MRRRFLSIAVSVFAVTLLVAGLAVSFLEEGGGYKISPEVTPAPPRADAQAGGQTGSQASAQASGQVGGQTPRTMPPAVTPARFKLRPDDATLVAGGKKNYATHCASCHGVNLEGQPNWQERGADGKLPAPPHDASGHTWHHPGGMLFAITKFGSTRITGQPSDMPGFSGVMSDEEIIGVLSYIKSTWPPEIRERHDKITNKGRG